MFREWLIDFLKEIELYEDFGLKVTASLITSLVLILFILLVIAVVTSNIESGFWAMVVMVLVVAYIIYKLFLK